MKVYAVFYVFMVDDPALDSIYLSKEKADRRCKSLQDGDEQTRYFVEEWEAQE